MITPPTLKLLHLDDDSSFLDLFATAVNQRRPSWSIDGMTADRVWLREWTWQVGDHLSDYDVIVIDYMLDDRNAEELIRTMRSSYDNCPPLMVLSGTLTADRSHRCRDEGAVLCAAKPRNPEDMEALLERIEDIAEDSARAWNPSDQR